MKVEQLAAWTVLWRVDPLVRSTADQKAESKVDVLVAWTVWLTVAWMVDLLAVPKDE